MERCRLGQSFSKIGECLGRAPGPVEYRWWTLADPHRKRQQSASRRCLKCRENFHSAHIGNRICRRCAKSDPFQSSALG